MGNSNSSPSSQTFKPSEVIQTNFPRLVNAIQPAVGDVARKAFGRNLITRQNMSDAENLLLPIDHRASTLLRQIHDRIETDEDQFETFMSVLRDVPILRDLAHDIMICKSTAASTTKPAATIRAKRKKKSSVMLCDVSLRLNRGSSVSSSNLSALTNQSKCDTVERVSDDLTSNGTPPQVPSSTVDHDNTMPNESSHRITVHRSSNNSQGESDLFSVNESFSELLSPDTNNSASGASTAPGTSSPPFQCRCGKSCSLDSFVKGSCLQRMRDRESKELFPYLKLDHLSRRDKEKLVRKLTSEARKMFDKFADLVVDTFDSLEEREVPIGLLRANTLTFGQQKLPRPYSDDHILKLAEANTVRDIQIFLVGYKYISFYNYGILQKIIEKFGTEKDKANLDTYLTTYRQYCKRSVFEVPSTTIGQLAPEVEEALVVKVNENQWFSNRGGKDKNTNFTMEDLYAVEESIAEVIGMEGTYILLRDVKEGCVELSLSVLSEAVVFPLTYLQRERLSSIGIDVTYQDVGRAEQHLCSLYRSLILSPKDLPLSQEDVSSGYGTLGDTGSASNLESPLTGLYSLFPRILPPKDMPRLYNDASSIPSALDSTGDIDSPVSAYSGLSGESRYASSVIFPDDGLLMKVLDHLMHNRNCQIPNCPCRQIQEWYPQLLATDCKVYSTNPQDSPDAIPRRPMHLTIAGAKAHPQPRIPPHTSSKSLSDLTPVSELPESPPSIAGTPVRTLGVSGEELDAAVGSPEDSEEILDAQSKPPVLLSEISISADNLPALCLNDCPITPSPLKNSQRSLGNAVKFKARKRFVSKPALKTVQYIRESESDVSDVSNTSSRSQSPIVPALSPQSDVDDPCDMSESTCQATEADDRCISSCSQLRETPVHVLQRQFGILYDSRILKATVPLTTENVQSLTLHHQYYSDSKEVDDSNTLTRLSDTQNSRGMPLSCSNFHDIQQPISQNALLVVLNCLMHNRDCQIPNCPCRQIQERHHQLLANTNSKVYFQASSEESPDMPRRPIHLPISAASNTHPHFHLTTKSYLRRTQAPISQHKRSKSLVDLTPLSDFPETPEDNEEVMPEPPVLLREVSISPDILPALCLNDCPITPSPLRNVHRCLRGVGTFIGNPEGSEEMLDVQSKPPILLREISLSADNLPALCLNDCPITPSSLKNSQRSLSNAVKLKTRKHFASKPSLKTVQYIRESDSDVSDVSNTSSRSQSPIVPVLSPQSDVDDGVEVDFQHEDSILSDIYRPIRSQTKESNSRDISRGESSGYESPGTLNSGNSASRYGAANPQGYKRNRSSTDIHLPVHDDHPKPQTKDTRLQLTKKSSIHHVTHERPSPYETDVRNENGVTMFTTEC